MFFANVGAVLVPMWFEESGVATVGCAHIDITTGLLMQSGSYSVQFSWIMLYDGAPLRYPIGNMN